MASVRTSLMSRMATLMTYEGRGTLGLSIMLVVIGLVPLGLLEIVG